MTRTASPLEASSREIVAALNAACGTKLDDIDAKFFEALLLVIPEDPAIQAAGGSIETLAPVLEKRLPDIMIALMRRQEQIFTRALCNEAFKAEIKKTLYGRVYDEIRAR